MIRLREISLLDSVIFEPFVNIEPITESNLDKVKPVKLVTCISWTPG